MPENPNRCCHNNRSAASAIEKLAREVCWDIGGNNDGDHQDGNFSRNCTTRIIHVKIGIFIKYASTRMLGAVTVGFGSVGRYP